MRQDSNLQPFDPKSSLLPTRLNIRPYLKIVGSSTFSQTRLLVIAVVVVVVTAGSSCSCWLLKLLLLYLLFFGTAVALAVTVGEFDAAVPHVVAAEVSLLVVVAANVVAAVFVKDWLSYKIK